MRKTDKPTMTVAEVRAKLAEYPDDLPVFGGWEGVWGKIAPDSFAVIEGALVIDVEDY